MTATARRASVQLGVAVALTDPFTPNVKRAGELLNEAGISHCLAGQPAGAEARVLIAGGFTPVDSSLLTALPRLEVVIRTGAGFDNVDMRALLSAAVKLVAPRLATDTSVAEYVFGAVIAIGRGLREATSP